MVAAGALTRPAGRGRGRAALLLLLAAAPAPAVDCTVLDPFARGRSGDFPPDWTVREEAGRAVYAIAEEGPLRFLRAVARGLGIQAARAHEWQPRERPVLAWRWRPQRFPAGGDERQARRNDSALAVYVVFRHTPVSVKSLKYVWSAVVPAGTTLESSRGLTKVRVLRSGTAGQGAWHEERVNVAEDYAARFDRAEVPAAAGIAVLTDSDDTASEAAGDYADFRLCRG